jgi:hypothetical protein
MRSLTGGETSRPLIAAYLAFSLVVRPFDLVDSARLDLPLEFPEPPRQFFFNWPLLSPFGLP